MSVEAKQRTGVVTGFTGENRVAPQLMLPPNVSPDALNVDYVNGSIKKRKGCKRLHGEQLRTGGIRITNDNDDKGIVIPNVAAYAFTGEYRIDMIVRPVSWDAGGVQVFSCIEAGYGFELAIQNDGAWGFMGGGLGALTGGVSASGDYPAANKTQRISFGAWNDGGTLKARIDIDGTSYVGTEVTSSAPGDIDFYVGIAHGSGVIATQTIDIFVDEIRIWTEWDHGYANTMYRELTDTEIDDAALVGYWKLNDGGPYNLLLTDLSGTGNHALLRGAGGYTLVPSLLRDDDRDYGAYALSGAEYLYAPYVDEWVDLHGNAGTTKHDWTVQFNAALFVGLTSAIETPQTLIQIGSPTEPLLLVYALWEPANGFYRIYAKFKTEGNAVQDQIVSAWESPDVLWPPGYPYAPDYTGTMFTFVYDSSASTLKVYMNSSLRDTEAVSVGNNPSFVASPGSHYGMYIGAEYDDATGTASNFAQARIDEVRIWNKALSAAEVGATAWAELVPENYDDLFGYWKLNGPSYWEDATGNSDIEVSTDDRDLPLWSAGFVGSVDGVSKVMALQPFVQPHTGVTQLVAATSSDLYVQSGESFRRLGTFNIPASVPWVTTQFHRQVILANRDVGVFKFDAQTAQRAIAPGTPDVTATSIASGATGAGLTGDYSYKFRFRNSEDGSVSVASAAVAVAGLSNADADISDIPVSTDPQVDQVEIFRTTAGGAAYYLLDRITNGTTTYNDAAADSTIVTQLNPYTGAPDAAAICVEHQDRLFLLNFDDWRSRMAWTELKDPLQPDVYPDFAFYAENYADVGHGDGDELSGAISAQGVLYLFKRNSVWAMVGTGPSTWQIQKLFAGIGCVSHNTIAGAPGGIYFLGQTGVMFWPYGGQPQDISTPTQRTLFEDMSEDLWTHAVGVYDPKRREYRVTFWANDEQVTLVWNEASGGWSRSDLHADAYAVVALTGNDVDVLAAYRGYVVRLNDGDNDGAETPEISSPTLTGTVTASGANYIDDSSAALDTDDDGFCGLTLRVTASNGTVQERVILYNTATRIYVTEEWDTNPSEDDTYAIAGIDCYWYSPWLSLHGDRGQESQIDRLHAWFKDDGNDVTVTATHATDDRTAQTVNLASGTRHNHKLITNRGMEFRLKFSNSAPDEPFELEGYQVLWEEAKAQ